MEIGALGRLLILMGVAIVVVGLVLVFADRIPGLGRLPGDLSFRIGNVRVFFPIVTMLIVSLLLTVVLNVVVRWFR
jgi:hypothetical protein